MQIWSMSRGSAGPRSREHQNTIPQTNEAFASKTSAQHLRKRGFKCRYMEINIVLTVVDEMCFFSISAQGQTSGLTACAEYPFARVCHAAEFRRKGRRLPSTATPRGRPPQTRNDHDPPHTTEGPPQARQAAAYPIRCTFHQLPILVYRKGVCAMATPAAKDRM